MISLTIPLWPHLVWSPSIFCLVFVPLHIALYKADPTSRVLLLFEAERRFFFNELIWGSETNYICLRQQANCILYCSHLLPVRNGVVQKLVISWRGKMYQTGHFSQPTWSVRLVWKIPQDGLIISPPCQDSLTHFYIGEACSSVFSHDMVVLFHLGSVLRSFCHSASILFQDSFWARSISGSITDTREGNWKD